MRMPSNRWMLTCCCAALLAGACLTRAEPAQAQISIGGIGINLGGMMGGGGRYSRGGGGRSRSVRSSRERDSDGSSSDDSSTSSRETRGDRNSRKDQVLASKGAPPAKVQTAILQSIAASEVLGVVGSTKDLEQVGRVGSKEKARDYTGKIREILDTFKAEQRKNTQGGDVTEQAIEQSLEKAFAAAKLDTFESFLGENWSVERLRVMILDLVSNEMTRLFDGNNRGNAPMVSLDGLIQRSAQSVYRRVFELSELLAANRSASLFVQRLYQTHGNLVDDHTKESADGMITQAANAAVAKFDGQLRRDENGFALRYRAQRIVLDCLSEHVERISSSDTAMRAMSEIEQKVVQTTSATCTQWLENQFGTERGKLNPQKPVPMRAVWSAFGPKDDPSMYGRASGGF
jgi:hypothetical protein